MMKVRFHLFSAARHYMIPVLLIGLRYSTVRRQFKNISGMKEEVQLIDY